MLKMWGEIFFFAIVVFLPHVKCGLIKPKYVIINEASLEFNTEKKYFVELYSETQTNEPI